MTKQRPLVDVVSPDTMDGDTRLEKVLNSLITNAFIGSGDLPPDECLSEARSIIRRIKLPPLTAAIIAKYLVNQFGLYNGNSDDIAGKIFHEISLVYPDEITL